MSKRENCWKGNKNLKHTFINKTNTDEKTITMKKEI